MSYLEKIAKKKCNKKKKLGEMPPKKEMNEAKEEAGSMDDASEKSAMSKTRAAGYVAALGGGYAAGKFLKSKSKQAK